ncbi:MAG TPA: efflux RND transporter permease subunit, partial [Candidatus Eisenbacteria bacterium]|nr:efflux RND transporter permease subunit [Candidatus Eisenbacteria bacterium]
LLFFRLGSEFVPRLNEGAIVINTIRLAGVSLDESVRYGNQIEKSLLAEFPDEIERVWTRTGTAEVATDPMGVELSDVFITLTDRGVWSKADSQEELVGKMEDMLSSMPGMRAVFTQPIEMRVNEMVAGVRADVAVKLFGDDFEVLKAKAREIENAMRATRGGVDVFTEQLTGQPVLEIEVDREAIARHGIPVRDVLDAVEMLGNRKVGTLQEGDRRFPIAMRLDDRYRTDEDAIGRILVSSVAGDRIPLSRLTTIRRTEGPATISREWSKRRIVVQANVRGRDVGSFVSEIRDRIAENVELPPGYYVRFGGQFEHLKRAETRLSIVVPIALATILGLLYLTFRSASDAIRVFSGVPLAAVGGILALLLRGLPFSISAAVGFIALSGVSVLNALVLVSTYRQLRTEGRDVEDALTQAADQRLRPVLMTALVASLGFVPMALNTGIGAEVQRPLATVVVGGVISSTLLTLFVLPALYLLTDRRRNVAETRAPAATAAS